MGRSPTELGEIAALLEGDGSAFGDLALDLVDPSDPSPAGRKALDRLFVPSVVFEFLEPGGQ